MCKNSKANNQTFVGLVGVQEQRAADLQLLVHSRILALQRANLLVALVVLEFHLGKKQTRI